MTRNEFIEGVQSWSELLDFCYDNSCDYCDEVYTDDAKDDYFDEYLVEMARNADGWDDLLSQLNDIPTGYDYYIHDDYGDWHIADDDDFDEFKSDVLDWADENDVWDDEENEYDEDDSEEESDEAEDDTDEIEFCSLEELFISCASSLQSIKVDKEVIQWI